MGNDAVYQPFNMCPFTMAQIGGGGGIGFDVQSYTWVHSPCMKTNCRLWVYKFEKEEVWTQGCSLQFLGLSDEGIKKDFALKTKLIKENK